MRLTGFILVALMFCAVPTFAAVKELKTSCDLFDCYTIFNIDSRDLTAYAGLKYDMTKGSFPLGSVAVHNGSVAFTKIEIINKTAFKVSGKIKGASSNLWGVGILGDNSHLNSTWWNSSYTNCKTITLTETAGKNRVNEPMEFNITGIANPDTARLVNAECGGGGNLQEFQQLTQTSDSIDIVWFANGTANSETYYGLYYNNKSAATNVNRTLFYVYETFNDGDYTNKPTWTVIDETFSAANGYLELTGAADYGVINSFIVDYPIDLSTVQLYFHFQQTGSRLSYFALENSTAKAATYVPQYGYIIYCDTAAEGFAFYRGANTAVEVNKTEEHGQCIDNVYYYVYGHRNTTGYWEIYNVSQDGVLLLSAQDTTYTKIRYVRVTGYVGAGGSHKWDLIYISNSSFNIYDPELVPSLGVEEEEATMCNISFISPTPANNVTHGFDYNTVINVTLSNLTACVFKIEWNKVNYTLTKLGTGASFLPNTTAGTLYKYRVICAAGTTTNTTETRTLLITSISEAEINNQITWESIPPILIILIIGFLCWLIFK